MKGRVNAFYTTLRVNILNAVIPSLISRSILKTEGNLTEFFVFT